MNLNVAHRPSHPTAAQAITTTIDQRILRCTSGDAHTGIIPTKRQQKKRIQKIVHACLFESLVASATFARQNSSGYSQCARKSPASKAASARLIRRDAGIVISADSSIAVPIEPST